MSKEFISIGAVETGLPLSIIIEITSEETTQCSISNSENKGEASNVIGISLLFCPSILSMIFISADVLYLTFKTSAPLEIFLNFKRLPIVSKRTILILVIKNIINIYFI